MNKFDIDHGPSVSECAVDPSLAMDKDPRNIQHDDTLFSQGLICYEAQPSMAVPQTARYVIDLPVS